jgi:hypothetical protein
LGKISDNELAFVIMTLYQLWLPRNDARNYRWRSAFLVEEWINVIGMPLPKSKTPKVEHDGWHKANSDGAFLQATGQGGGGAVIRNHHGEFVAGSSHFSPMASGPAGLSFWLVNMPCC